MVKYAAAIIIMLSLESIIRVSFHKEKLRILTEIKNFKDTNCKDLTNHFLYYIFTYVFLLIFEDVIISTVSVFYMIVSIQVGIFKRTSAAKELDKLEVLYLQKTVEDFLKENNIKGKVNVWNLEILEIELKNVGVQRYIHEKSADFYFRSKTKRICRKSTKEKILKEILELNEKRKSSILNKIKKNLKRR